MASPHAVGVAALIVSQYGKDRSKAGVTLAPVQVERSSRQRAGHPLPDPAPVPLPGSLLGARVRRRPARATPPVNGFYGDGIVSAFNAVTSRR